MLKYSKKARGTISNITFYKSGDGYLARERGGIDELVLKRGGQWIPIGTSYKDFFLERMKSKLMSLILFSIKTL